MSTTNGPKRPATVTPAMESAASHLPEVAQNMPALETCLLAITTQLKRSKEEAQIQDAQQWLFDFLSNKQKTAIFSEKSLALIKKHIPLLAQLIVYGKRTFQDKRVLMEYGKAIEKLRSAMSKEDYEQLMNEIIMASKRPGGEIFGIIYYANRYNKDSTLAICAFMRSEELGHDLAYKPDNNKTVHQLANLLSEGSVEYNRLQIAALQANQHRNEALVGQMLIPDPNPNRESPSTIYILWMGTSSKETVLADGEVSPGEESFRMHENEILQHIIQQLNSHNEPVNLVFTGHSLGGSLAQLSFHSFQRALAKRIARNSKNDTIADKVGTEEAEFTQGLKPRSMHLEPVNVEQLRPELVVSMSVDTWNSAGVTRQVANSSDILSEFLVAQGVPQYAHIGWHDGDLVQQTGEASILSNVSRNGAQISVMRMNPQARALQIAADFAPIGAIALGAAVGSVAGPAGSAAGAAVGGVAALGIYAVKKVGRHTAKHFKTTAVSDDNDDGASAPEFDYNHRKYKLYHSNVSLHVPKIADILTRKSTLLKAGAAIISSQDVAGRHQADFLKLANNGDVVAFQKAVAELCNHWFAWLPTRNFFAQTSKADRSGNTPLHIIAAKNDIALLEIIFNQNVSASNLFNFNVRNHEGLLPIHVAAQQGNIDLVRAMRRHTLACKDEAVYKGILDFATARFVSNSTQQPKR